jgi:hypothetical protein
MALVRAKPRHHSWKMSRVSIGAAEDGTLTYLIDHPPSDLPAVGGGGRPGALARDAAHRAAWSVGRAFRFRTQDGGWTDLALHDADARCWAGAVDRAVGMQTAYGLSVCLRLLALIEFLARTPWTAGLIDLSHEAELHPALLRLAAEARLTDDATFDEHGFKKTLQTLPATARPSGATHA